MHIIERVLEHGTCPFHHPETEGRSGSYLICFNDRCVHSHRRFLFTIRSKDRDCSYGYWSRNTEYRKEFRLALIVVSLPIATDEVSNLAAFVLRQRTK